MSLIWPDFTIGRRGLRGSSKETLDHKRTTGFATVVLAGVSLVDEGLCVALPNGCAIVGITSAKVLLVGGMWGLP